MSWHDLKEKEKVLEVGLIRVEDAKEIILGKIESTGFEKISIDDALGRILAEDIFSGRNNPPLDNSAMDGYALIAEDIKDATPDTPVRLDVSESVAAGYESKTTLTRGQAIRIMTGAPIPKGADSVLMQEDTEKLDGAILVKDKTDEGENIRLAGEDVKTGECVIKAGIKLCPSHIGMLAVIGRSRVLVGQRPKIAILSTGDEIMELDETPEGPQIFNSNGHMLAAQVRSAGAIPVYLGIAKDEEADLLQKLKWALNCDAIVSSGGVSVGDYDLVKDSLDKLGNEMAFWKVAMKPGKPLAFGKISGKPVFGLPGNPVSSFVSFEQFVRPSVKKMMGAKNLEPMTVRARLSCSIRKKTPRLHFMSAEVTRENDEYRVSPARVQGSGVLKSAMNANGLLVFPLDKQEIKEGELVSVQLLDT